MTQTTKLGTVLLVDDDTDARTMLSMLLAGYDIEVLEAGSGEEALELLKTNSPSLVLLDFDMPGIDGVTTLKHIREEFSSRELPVVMVSNRQDAKVVVGALDNGADDYVNKATDPTIMLARIRRHLIREQMLEPEKSPFGGVLGEYKLGKKMGESAAADLYQATHLESKETVAIKVLRPGFKADHQSYAQWSTFCHELLADLQAVEAEPVDYLVYQWVDGTSLDTYVEGKELSKSEVLRLASSLAEAVNAVHQIEKRHGELRPSNVKVLANGETRVLDFGFTELLIRENALKRSDELIGHPAYLAPEQLQSPEDVGKSADLYAVGALIFTLATSRMPFDGSMAEVLHQVLHDKPPKVSHLRADGERSFDFLCSRLMDKKPQNRYADCSEVLQKLRELSEE